MAGRGPSPTPTAILKLTGSKRGKARAKTEPKPIAGAPAMPAGLTASERACWRRLLAEVALVPGLVASVDRSILAMVAKLEAQLMGLREKRQAEGETVVRRDDRGVVVSVQLAPWARLEATLLPVYKSALMELGLTPSSRSRVKVEAPAAGSLNADRFFGPRAVPMRKVGA